MDDFAQELKEELPTSWRLPDSNESWVNLYGYDRQEVDPTAPFFFRAFPRAPYRCQGLPAGESEHHP